MITPVRDHLVNALYADLVGPFGGAHAHATSRELTRNPWDWYFTGLAHEERAVGDTLNAEEATGEPAPSPKATGPALEMGQAAREVYAQETGDPTWTRIEIPPFTTPIASAEKATAQAFEDHLERLFALSAERSRA